MTDYERWEKRVMDEPFPQNMLECIERFLTEVHPHLEPGQDIYPEVFATDLFFPLQRQAELRRMMQIARKVGQKVCDVCYGHGVLGIEPGHRDDPRVSLGRSPCERCRKTGLVGGPEVVMEIGADKGGSLYHWCKCFPTVERVIACEVRGTPYRHLFEKAFQEIEFLWLEGSSWEPGAVKATSASLGRRVIDCLFIDGDKGAFLRDFDAYLPLVNPKGVVFMHDVNEPARPMQEDFFKASQGRRSEVIVDVTDSLTAVRREREGLPPKNPHEAWLLHWRGRSCGVGVIRLGEKP